MFVVIGYVLNISLDLVRVVGYVVLVLLLEVSILGMISLVGVEREIDSLLYFWFDEFELLFDGDVFSDEEYR